MGLLLDFLIILIIGLIVLTYSRRGFIYSAANFAGYIISACIAGSFSGSLAKGLFENSIRPGVIEKISDAIEAQTAQSVSNAIEKALEAFPSFLNKAVGALGFNSESTIQSVEHSVENAGQSMATAIADKVIGPVIISLLQALMFFIIFGILIFVVHIIARVLRRTIHNTIILGGADRALGALFGFLIGVVVILCLIALLHLIVPFLSEDFPILNQENIDKSHLFKLIYNNNIILN